MARDLAPHGVRCNAIAPGARTPMASGEGFERRIAKLVEEGTLSGEEAEAVLTMPGPEFVAPLYTFLASDAATAAIGSRASADSNALILVMRSGTVPVCCL